MLSNLAAASTFAYARFEGVEDGLQDALLSLIPKWGDLPSHDEAYVFRWLQVRTRTKASGSRGLDLMDQEDPEAPSVEPPSVEVSELLLRRYSWMSSHERLIVLMSVMLNGREEVAKVTRRSIYEVREVLKAAEKPHAPVTVPEEHTYVWCYGGSWSAPFTGSPAQARALAIADYGQPTIFGSDFRVEDVR